MLPMCAVGRTQTGWNVKGHAKKTFHAATVAKKNVANLAPGDVKTW